MKKTPARDKIISYPCNTCGAVPTDTVFVGWDEFIQEFVCYSCLRKNLPIDPERGWYVDWSLVDADLAVAYTYKKWQHRYEIIFAPRPPPGNIGIS